MSDPFIGEIRMFAGNFAPRGWAFTNGQLLSVSQNDALFSLFGTIYGGDGRTTFGLPDMRGRIPLHEGTGSGLTPRRPGSRGGQESVTITANQMPAHRHRMRVDSQVGKAQSPSGNYFASASKNFSIYETSANVTMASSMITNVGGSRPHTNLMPTLCVNYIVALVGIYPSRS